VLDRDSSCSGREEWWEGERQIDGQTDKDREGRRKLKARAVRGPEEAEAVGREEAVNEPVMRGRKSRAGRGGWGDPALPGWLLGKDSLKLSERLKRTYPGTVVFS